ncbi:MAG: hypothetical protein GX366_05140 [Epulopiscium sp.]|nr:hypothetical protein [Candidatus Epulonipiscium sp.]
MRVGVSKGELIKSLESTLKLTREGIQSVELVGYEDVIVHYNCGNHRMINIACCSGLAIIKEVANRV